LKKRHCDDGKRFAVQATLIFPAVNRDAHAYFSAAIQRGERVVCSASMPADQAGVDSSTYVQLPSIYDPGFAQRFSELVEEMSIDRLFCPVSTVHNFMLRFLAQHMPTLTLIGESPIQQQIDQHRRLMSQARRLQPFVQACSGKSQSPLTVTEIAGVLRQASLIYGESNDDKLAAMMGALSTGAKGDVVEIGSLMGRSAFVLLYMARRFELGPLLTVDPWSLAECTQHDSPDGLKEVSGEWDFQVLGEGLHVHLAPFVPDDHAHIRLPSRSGFERYISTGTEIFAESGKVVDFERRVGCIHIDGNHDYAAVREDCELWLTRLKPGAWLILDDYVWDHGDGPRRVGDDLLCNRAADIECAFVSGKALFVKFRN
jgi:hypothetical protein